MKNFTDTQPNLADIYQQSCSYVDPNGFLFDHEGKLYRGIFPEKEPFYRQLLAEGFVDELSRAYHLVPTRIADFSWADGEVKLVLQHERIEPQTFCVEWCGSMLRDAAIAQLELSLALIEHGCMLQDCYPWNVLFQGTRPVIVDFTSIVPAVNTLIWPAYEQFRAFFLRPLILAGQKKGGFARMLLYQNIRGVTLDDLVRLSDFSYKLLHPGLVIENQTNNFVQRRSSLKRKLRQVIQDRKEEVPQNLRRRFFQRLLNQVKTFRFSGKGDLWGDYYSRLEPGIDHQKKLQTIDAIVKRLKFQDAVDIGCNTGVFSVIAARTGAPVISLDSSEACIEKLYSQAKSEKLSITPLVVDVLCPTPAYGFLGRQYAPLVERTSSDLALCLGLMHHLHITGRQSFHRIAELMSAFAKRHLIFEYIDQSDDNNLLLEAGRPIKYSFEEVTENLQRYFPSIEVLDSDRPTRKLLVCSRRD